MHPTLNWTCSGEISPLHVRQYKRLHYGGIIQARKQRGATWIVTHPKERSRPQIALPKSLTRLRRGVSIDHSISWGSNDYPIQKLSFVPWLNNRVLLRIVLNALCGGKHSKTLQEDVQEITLWGNSFRLDWSYRNRRLPSCTVNTKATKIYAYTPASGSSIGEQLLQAHV